MKTFLAALLTLAMAGTALAQNAALRERLLTTERAFAQEAQANRKAAFLKYMADSALMPEKGLIVLAKAVWEARPDHPTGTLAWEPDQAEVSLEGDMGYTAGPWTYTQEGKASTGHFATVWLRQPDESYRWAMDIGIEHPRQAATMMVKASGKGSKSGETAESLLEHDSTFASALPMGQVEVYQKVLSKDARLLRNGYPPAMGKEAIADQLIVGGSRMDKAAGSRVAEAGDLGYVYGTYKALGSAEHGCYLRVWRREGKAWKLVLEVLEPAG